MRFEGGVRGLAGGAAEAGGSGQSAGGERADVSPLRGALRRGGAGRVKLTYRRLVRVQHRALTQ